MRTMFTLAVAILLTCWAAAVQAQPSNGSSGHFSITFDSYGDLIQGVEGVPLEMRQVPIHKDDGGAGQIVTIPNQALHPKNFLTMGIAIGPQFRIGNTLIKFSPYVSFVKHPSDLDKESGVEKNYQGSGRTEGAALVYYALVAKTAFRPGMDIQIKHRLSEYFIPIVGYRLSPYRLEIENGWDRYNHSEEHQSYRLSNNIIHAVSGGIGVGPLALIYSRVYNHASLTDLGRQLDLRQAKVGSKISFEITTGF